MWQHNYTPIHGSLLLSSLAAALPIFVLLFLLGVRRTPAWIAAISGLGTTALVSFFLYGMPVGRIVSAAAYGAAYGWFPIGWIVIWAVYLYRLTLDTGKFETIKHSLRSLTRDPRLQTLLIAFAFGAFTEGCAGFGTPVAVAAAMMVGLGFSSYYASSICLLANTAPVAFGSIGIPVITLASGRVAEIDARLGDTVTKGQLLMKVQSADIASAYSDYQQALADETVRGRCATGSGLDVRVRARGPPRERPR